MKKLAFTVLIMAILSPFASAGDIGNIIGVDMMIGMAGGAAMGCAFATPSYMGGSQKDGTTFLVGAGWGVLVGSVVGLAYGIYGVVDHVNMRSKSKASIDTGNVYVDINTEKNGIQLTRNF
jgi:hypothetical protein